VFVSCIDIVSNSIEGDARPIVVFKDPVTQETVATPYTLGVTLSDIRNEYLINNLSLVIYIYSLKI
jgi:hypothetical protein